MCQLTAVRGFNKVGCRDGQLPSRCGVSRRQFRDMKFDEFRESFFGRRIIALLLLLLVIMKCVVRPSLFQPIDAFNVRCISSPVSRHENG